MQIAFFFISNILLEMDFYMHCQLSKIINNYKELIKDARQYEMVLPKSSITALLVISLSLFATAMIGFSQGGHYFAFTEINNLAPYIPSWLLENITVFGDGIFLLALVLLLSCRNPRFHWTILFVSLVSAVVVNLLKDYYAIPRPPAVLDPEAFNLLGRGYTSRSFPSGHSMTGFLVASVCICYTKNNLLKVLFMTMAVLVALSRVLIGVHWPMDVLVGGSLGILLGVGGVVVTAKWKAGICPFVHLFTVGILIIACVVIFVDGNDYNLALPMLYFIAGAALFQAIRRYVFVK